MNSNERREIRVGDKVFVLDFSQVTMGEYWSVINGKGTNAEINIRFMALMVKVLGIDFLSLPIIYAAHVQGRVLQELVFLVAPDLHFEDVIRKVEEDADSGTT